MIIEEAGDSFAAFEMLKSFKPDLIFMDVRLPGLSGLTLTEKIKRRHPEIAIVILTEYDLPEYRKAADFGGADEFLAKGTLNLAEVAEILVRIQKSRI